MKINDIILEVIKEMAVEYEIQKDYPYEKCPYCESDDFDVYQIYSKKCYNCGKTFSFIELKEICERKAIINFESKIISKCGKMSRKIKADL